MGKLIKAYAERNGITPEFNKGHKPERRAKVLSKVFGGEPTEYAEFQELHSQMRIGELIKKYAEVKGIDIKDKKPWNKELSEKRL